ncbi:hypothetical protein A2U01_0062051, partial [Trifolium medium]|nr:hypothetical protein [Trifolium medium]
SKAYDDPSIRHKSPVSSDKAETQSRQEPG